jgi:3-deoxy-manno-octulosonate cytidylyltransferase (CMP-KDO synthetase)
MIEFDNTLVVITASMSGKALPGTPMLDVNGKPLVMHAVHAAELAKLGKVLVATPDLRVADTVRAGGGDAVVCAPQTAQSGQAADVLAMRDPARMVTHVVVMPCTLASIEHLSLRRCLAGLLNPGVDAATIVVEVSDIPRGRVTAIAPITPEREAAYLRSLSRSEGGRDGLQLIPVYAWTRGALERFAARPVLPQEQEPGLELLRALAGGLRCVAVKVDSLPLTVDTAENLAVFRQLMKV